jgi:large subunit ribosomal protein L21
MTDMTDYAIVESGGQQFRVEKGTELVVDRVPAGEGEKVLLRPVAFLGDGSLVAAGDDLEKVKVEATVSEHMRGPKLTVFKYKAKKGYRRRAGHRQEQSRLEVTEVKLLTRKPAAKTPAATKTETKPAAEETKPAAKKPAAKKPAAKKPAAKKPTAKKPAAKKPAAKKPAAKKPAAKKESK